MANEGLAGPATTSSSGTNVGSATFTRGSIKYDSPFLDMTSTFIPSTIKGILKFVAAYALGDGLVSQCICKMAEYPITDLIYNDEDPSSIKDDQSIDYWKDLLEKKLKLIKTLKQSGMDHYAYGNSLISISYPFQRRLKCSSCGNNQSIDSEKTKFRAYKFYSKCIKCGHEGEMKAYDINTKELDKFSIVHWDLMCLDIKYNSITGDHFYYYSPPSDLKVAIQKGDIDIIKTTRVEVIEAVQKNKKLKLMEDNVFHLKRAAPQYMIPSQRGWGIPVIMPVMKDIFHNKILKKGNEMIAFDHIVPLRILFPQGTGDVSPHATINLSGWKTKIEDEIGKWKADPNYISIVPLPIGMETFSGDAKILSVTPEIKVTEDAIITGIGIIPEIIRGGASWSGSNVSLRVVENTFLNHRNDMQEMIDFIIENLARYLDKPCISVKMSDFKMADDLQKKELMLKASSGRTSDAIISRSTVTKELGFDPEEEYKLREKEIERRIELTIKETEGEAEAQGSGMLINSMYAADADMERQNRMSMYDREQQAKRDEFSQLKSEENAQMVEEEVDALNPGNPKMSVQNVILVVTRRFARLLKLDADEFKIRMLAMKNSTPALYQEVFNNLKEMNLIEADTSPNLGSVQKYTPGQIPSHIQGEETAEQPPTPAEANADPGVINQPLPEARPPRSAVNSSV